MKLYITYHEDCYDAERDEDGYGHVGYDKTYTSCKLSKPNHNYYESVDINFNTKVGQIVYLCDVLYDSGSTFGIIAGLHSIIGVYATFDEAKRTKSEVLQEVNLYKNSNDPPYRPWFGYFEKFRECNIIEMSIKK